MPSYTRDKKRDQLTYVPVNDILLYGFKTKDLSSIAGVSLATLQDKLGHISAQAAAALTGKILVLGANAPKPPRVTKKIANASAAAQQSVSTFCSKSTLALAMQDGWTVSNRGRGVILTAPSAAKPQQTAIATLSDGTLYCFSLNKEDFTSFSADLGLEGSSKVTSDTERKKLVFGTNIPKPGKAKRVLPTGATFTSYYSTNKAGSLGTAGFGILTEELVLATAPAPAP